MTERLQTVVDGLDFLGNIHWQFAAAMFVQVSVLFAILLVLDLLLLRRRRAAVRYGIWSLVLIKLLLPVSLSSPISLSQWLPEIKTANDQVSPSVAEAAASLIANNETTLAQTPLPAPQGQVAWSPATPFPTAQTALPHVAEDRRPVVERRAAESSVAASPPVVTAPPRPSLQWQAWLVLAWFTVVVALGVYVVRRTWQVWRLVSEAAKPPAATEPLLDECLKRAGMTGRNVKLRVVDQLGSPAICGFWRPTILLPRNLVGRLDDEQLRFIFMHEICHWRRFDMHVNFLQTLLQIFYFYHPLVWVTNAILRRSREQAVDEAVLVLLRSPKVDYGETLLNVASMQREATTFSLQLIGVVESRKALAGRIKRILTRPLPKTARLGLTGVGAILLSGLFLLPMAGREEPSALAANSPETIATQPEENAATVSETSPEASATEVESDEEPVAESSVLSGRITDETGAPVTDATLELRCRRPRDSATAPTDSDGRYRVESIKQAGEFEVIIKSTRWVGINYWEDTPRIRLTPNSSAERDFQLRRASRLRVRVVDEEGNPIKGVRLLAGGLADERWRGETRASTDAQGWAMIGAFAPSDKEYIVGTMRDEYGFGKLTIKLTDPEVVAEREIVLQKGTTITGKALCSDGEPPAGWRIGAMPSWWRFGVSPMGSVVAEDGSFSLSHIVPGPYDVKISIPRGETGSSPRRVLENAELTEMPQPLSVKLDHPSPASLVFITGRVEHSGGSEEHGFWIFADDVGRREHSSFYVREGKSEFKIGRIQTAATPS